MALKWAISLALCTDTFAARIGKKKGSTKWHTMLYDGVMESDRSAPPAFFHLHEKKVYVSNFGVRRGILPLPAESDITTLSVNDIASAFSSGRMRNLPQALETSGAEGFKWPNKLDHAPPSVAGSGGDILVIPDGFLVPGKRTGGIFFHRNGKLHRISAIKENAFYHEVEWRDMNGDGHLDILCPRAIINGTFSVEFRGEFMWYENPGPSKVMSQEWKEHKIVDGPDVICHTKDYKNGLVSFCSQFWTGTGKLVMHGLTKQGVHKWSRVIDHDCLKCFSVKPVDIDGDGVLDLLSTNHPDKKDQSAVFGYEVPWDNLESGSFKKHVLATNIFQTILGNAGVGAPGFPEAFHPRVGDTSGPVDIVVAGDGSLDVWHLAPIQGQRFSYEARQVRSPRGTTGKMLVHDFDGDGIMDVLVPDNDLHEIWGFTFRAGAPPATTPEPRECPWWCSGPGSCQNQVCKLRCDKCFS